MIVMLDNLATASNIVCMQYGVPDRQNRVLNDNNVQQKRSGQENIIVLINFVTNKLILILFI
jgi:hypothetical protein